MKGSTERATEQPLAYTSFAAAVIRNQHCKAIVLVHLVAILLFSEPQADIGTPYLCMLIPPCCNYEWARLG